MNIFIHLLLTTLIVWVIFSYLAGTYILFVSPTPIIKEHKFHSLMLIWFLSPLVVLVWIWNKVNVNSN